MTSQRTRDRLISRIEEKGVRDSRVLEVMANTPRHLFLDEALAHHAYEDKSLPIGFGQTLSQPYIVARMTEVLLGANSKLNKVLEIGTGSGYQTAVLAQFVDQLFSIERIRPLQDKARERLRKLGLRNVQFQHSDGGVGWSEQAPFDGILSAAAPRDVPEALLQQLAPGGVLVIPVGTDQQHLTVVTRHAEENTFHHQQLEAVHFVPLLSGVTR